MSKTQSRLASLDSCSAGMARVCPAMSPNDLNTVFEHRNPSRKAGRVFSRHRPVVR
jgi:hypothetical protein